jgi:hypothetical protein
VESAYRLATAAGLAPITIDPEYKNSVLHSLNVSLQREIAPNIVGTIAYVLALGRNLRLSRNLNQPIDGVRPYPSISVNSPILPGTPLGNITQVESTGSSRYTAVWTSVTRRLSHGLTFSGSYPWSRSWDTNSLSTPPTAITVQIGYDVADSWGPSDFDARHRFALHAAYETPSTRGALLRDWRVAAILQGQSGNPVNIVTSNSVLTGVANTVRPDVVGPIDVIGEVNQWFDPSVFVAANGFGNLRRNTVVGPRFDSLDMSLAKTLRYGPRVRTVLQADVFNVLNHPNYGQTGRIVGTPNFAVITNTRFPPGDSGSSRQVQLGVKVVF